MKVSLNNVNYYYNICNLITAQQAADERETHERSSGGPAKQVADRRIDIQPAEDEEGKTLY